MNLVFMTYNNYYNRIVKKLNTVADYKAAAKNEQEFSNIQFNPNDGITTDQIINWTDNTWEPDYVIVYDSTVGSNIAIESRWFVIEWTRTRANQYKAILKRDVIADYYSDILAAPIYLEKGYIEDVNNPLLYNSESVSFNQIKQNEFPITDETSSGWVVGYVPADAFASSTKIEKEIAVPVNPNITVTNLSDWSLWAYCTNNPNFSYMADEAGRKQVALKIKDYYMQQTGTREWTYFFSTKLGTFYTNSNDASSLAINQGPSSIRVTTSAPVYPSWYTNWSSVTYSNTLGTSLFTQPKFETAVSNIKNSTTFNSYVNAVLGGDVVIGNVDNLRGVDGKIIYDQNSQQYFRIKLISISSENMQPVSTSTTAGANLVNYINNNLVRTFGIGNGSLDGNYGTNEVSVGISAPSYALTLENVGIGVEVSLDSDRSHLNDAPYDMFCIPYSDTLQLTDGTDTFTVSKAIALGIATEIGKDSGTNNIYDVQLLPYCPNRALILGSSDPNILDLRNVKYDIITESATHEKKSAVIWCTDSSFSFEAKLDPTDLKFTAPYSEVPIPQGTAARIKTDTYYALREIDAITVTRCAISTGSNNFIEVLTCNRETGEVSAVDWYNTVEIVKSDEINLHIYKYGNYANPEISISRADYNVSDSYFVIYIKLGSGIAAQNIETFVGMLEYPTSNALAVPADPIERKVSNECNLYRLVSNNYNGIFEFSVAKSNGVDGFIIDCTYKPWAPYIHIIPKLKGLYGENFVTIDDARGLICGGDYSIPQLSNAWSNYQLQNKTYQDMFDRQIKNMDVMNDITKQEALVSAVLSPISGAVSGAVAGASASAGNPYVAAAGAIIGGISTSIAAGMDYTNTLKRMEENRDYAIDMYNFNLQNIQAIPTSLTKTSALVYNTRIFPFVEYYTCTDIEKQALKDKLKYNGMTIMAISTLSNYVGIGTEPHFYKGKIIRLEDITSDSHVAYVIYDELNKGVYL